MKIAVEGLGATVGPADGAGRYLLGLLEAFARREDVTVTVFVGPSMRAAVEGLGLAEVVVVPGGRVRRLLAQHLTVPRAARRARADVALYLGNYAPLLRGPRAVSVMASLLITVDDPTVGVPEASRGPLARARMALFARARARYHRLGRSQLRRRADAVVAISQTLADALEDVCPSLRGRVRVVPPPLDVARVAQARSAEISQPPEPFFLAVGRPWGYRDYPLAFDALAASGLAHSLVIVGEATPEERRPLEEHARKVGLGDRVTFAGIVDDLGELRSWYERSAALVATSSLESFGQPLGEAMALGTPVVAVNRTAFPEIVGDGGLLVDPTVEGVAEGLRRVVRPEERERLARSGRSRAAAYTWDDSAARLLDICREVAPEDSSRAAGRVLTFGAGRGPKGDRDA